MYHPFCGGRSVPAAEPAYAGDSKLMICALTMDEAAERIAVVNEWLEAVDLVLLRPPVLSRASEPMPMPLGTLDAIHLATALLWRDRFGPLPQLVTHDAALGGAARGFGFDVRGI